MGHRFTYIGICVYLRKGPKPSHLLYLRQPLCTLCGNRSNFVEKKYQELKTRLQEINDLNSVNALLNWDQSTYMPPGGAAARGRQQATLGRIAHEKFVDPGHWQAARQAGAVG